VGPLPLKAHRSREEYDRRDAALSVARADVTQAQEDTHQIRVSLGLPSEPENSGNLGDVPPGERDKAMSGHPDKIAASMIDVF
jgi:hypothetical protein